MAPTSHPNFTLNKYVNANDKVFSTFILAAGKKFNQAIIAAACGL
jgi:hypothetical protein